jgi:DNA polymerase III delta subunit
MLKKGAMASYVQHPSPETVLILCASTLKPGRARKRPAKGGSLDILAFLQQQERSASPCGAVLEFKGLTDSTAQQWIAQSFKDAGRVITPEAVTVMHAIRGNGTRVLSSEIEKMLSAMQQTETIEAEDVYLHLGASRLYNVFELSNAVMTRDGAKAQEILSHLLGLEDPLMIMNMLSRQLTALWRVRSIQFQGRCTEEQARSVGLYSAWQVENLRPYVKNFPDSAYFERCFEYILETDLAIKSQPDNPAIAVTRLISALTIS